MKRGFPFVFLLLCLLARGEGLLAQNLRIATYNIRYDNPADVQNPWKGRLPAIINLIQFHDFDLFGTQEALHHQVQDLQQGLGNYAYIGVGRDDGQEAGEYTAIYYKKDKFKLLKRGDFWLSPDISRPNKGWDAALPRICSWGQFQVKATGFSFYFFNVHFDHQGVEARRESTLLVLEQIRKIAGNAPAVLCGDFNFDQDHENYLLLANSGLLQDAYELSPLVYAPNGTYNGFDISNSSGSRIDHIFLTPHFKVQKYGILTDSYQGKFPSDHLPVFVQLLFYAFL